MRRRNTIVAAALLIVTLGAGAAVATVGEPSAPSEKTSQLPADDPWRRIPVPADSEFECPDAPDEGTALVVCTIAPPVD